MLAAALLLPITGFAAKPGWFGLGVTLHDSATPAHTKWLYVRVVDSDGPAAAAGLQVSDIITAIDGKPVAFATNADLLRFFEAAKPRTKLTFSVVRRQRKLAVTVTAVPLPDKYAQRRGGDRRVRRKPRSLGSGRYVAAARRIFDVGKVIDVLRSAKRIGFLFSGGSARCVFQVGVVETLLALDVRPAMCLGVSAGVWNAAAVAVGNAARLRAYWRFFNRMPCWDVRNLLREHSPFIWPRLHERAFERYGGRARVKAPGTLPLYIALTRLRDKQQLIIDARQSDDPLCLLLASNYLPPFYTHTPPIDGERCGDGGFSNNIPYEFLFERGCDAVVLMAAKGESEGGLHRNVHDCEHVVPPAYAERVVVIRPRHRLPLGFVERRWEKLAPIADLGALRAREVLLGERHPQTDVAARGLAPSAYYSRLRRWLTT